MRIRGIASIAVGALSLIPTGVAGASGTPQLTAVASGGGKIGDAQLADTATLSGSSAATGSITFDLFGPDDPTCSEEPFDSSTADVQGDGEYVSPEAFPDTTGSYRFVARYGGDGDNAAVATDCADVAQELTVTPAAPTLVSTASPAVTTGQQISDTARLAEAYVPTEELRFDLFGPDDAACSREPIASSMAPLSEEDDRATSAPFTPSLPGVYRWVASYPGDARNLPASGTCGDAGESVTVSAPVVAPTPALKLRASDPAAFGGQIWATAMLSSLAGLTGSLNFRVYGPGDDRCRAGALWGSTQPVFGAGDYTSDPFTPRAPGVYRWVVSYSGDGGVATATDCGDPAAAVSVAPPRNPVPVLGRSFTVSDVHGTVRVKEAAGASGHRAAAAARGIGFVEVHGQRSVPVGSTIDARDGTAGLDAATPSGAIQTGQFRGIPFVARQGTRDSSVELELGSDARNRGSCGAPGSRAGTSKHGKAPPDLLRRLHSRVRGHFHIKARFSFASARNASWTTVERCDGTLTQVSAGTVRVLDRRLHRSFTVHAGEHHFASARG